MKLSVFTENMKEQKWWFNFRKSNDPNAWPHEVLKEKYNASLVKDNNGLLYIEFKSKEDMTYFKLKFS